MKESSLISKSFWYWEWCGPFLSRHNNKWVSSLAIIVQGIGMEKGEGLKPKARPIKTRIMMTRAHWWYWLMVTNMRLIMEFQAGSIFMFFSVTLGPWLPRISVVRFSLIYISKNSLDIQLVWLIFHYSTEEIPSHTRFWLLMIWLMRIWCIQGLGVYYSKASNGTVSVHVFNLITRIQLYTMHNFSLFKYPPYKL